MPFHRNGWALRATAAAPSIVAPEPVSGHQWVPLAPRLHDPLQLHDPLGERRRTWLEDVSGLDFVDLSRLDRGQPIPSGPRRDPLAPHRLAAPRADDDVGGGRNDLLARDDS